MKTEKEEFSHIINISHSNYKTTAGLKFHCIAIDVGQETKLCLELMGPHFSPVELCLFGSAGNYECFPSLE